MEIQTVLIYLHYYLIILLTHPVIGDCDFFLLEGMKLCILGLSRLNSFFRFLEFAFWFGVIHSGLQ